MCLVKLFFKPEQTIEGRKPLHGIQQLLHSNCFTVRNLIGKYLYRFLNSYQDITGKCIIENGEQFRKREIFPSKVFYCEFQDFSSYFRLGEFLS